MMCYQLPYTQFAYHFLIIYLYPTEVRYTNNFHVNIDSSGQFLFDSFSRTIACRIY